MRRVTATALAATVFVTALVTAQDAIPPALQAMADTEREFARTATTKGIRDSFLDFFAEDAIAFAPEPTSSRARLLKQPSRPFSVHELLWEPRFGDVAASGEIGWLTGPSTFIDHESPDQKPHYGNYLSVWRKQPDGRWRVFIDIGVPTPAEVTFAPGFTRMPSDGRYTRQGRQGRGYAEPARRADRELNAAIAASGAAKAYRRSTDLGLTAASRNGTSAGRVEGHSRVAGSPRRRTDHYCGRRGSRGVRRFRLHVRGLHDCRYHTAGRCGTFACGRATRPASGSSPRMSRSQHAEQGRRGSRF